MMSLSSSFVKDDFNSVELTNSLSPRIRIKPMYYHLGFSANAKIYAREAVRKRLLALLDVLPAHLGVEVWDVYRPRAVQATLFAWMQQEIKKRSPHLSEEENYLETKKFMSPPSKPGDAYCPPHLSGGAVDLSLFELHRGHNLDMGTEFDDCTIKASRDYYLTIEPVSLEDRRAKEARAILRTSMEQVGFSSYEHEWWHFDLGNIFWSQHFNCPAVFGPLFGDNELAGE